MESYHFSTAVEGLEALKVLPKMIEIIHCVLFSELRLMRRHNNIANNPTKDGVRPAVTSEHCTSAKSKDVPRTGTVGRLHTARQEWVRSWGDQHCK